MVHAIEAYTSRHQKNVLSDTLAREALKLLGANIRWSSLMSLLSRTINTLQTGV